MVKEQQDTTPKEEVKPVQSETLTERSSVGSRKTESFARTKEKVIVSSAPKEQPESKDSAVPKEPKKAIKTKEPSFKFKIFDRWDIDIEVRDHGLKPYLTLSPVLVPYSAGRTASKQFHKSKKNIIELLMNKIYVSCQK